MSADWSRDDLRRKKVAANLLAGMGPHEIAEAIGEPPDVVAGDVRQIVGQWVQDQAETGGTGLDLQRLDLAINALWTDVQKGDRGAVELLIKIVRLRRQLDDSYSQHGAALPGLDWNETSGVTVCHDGQREADDGQREADDGQREADERELERLPRWAPEYLACWGSKRPDGGRMTVSFAAEFAGTTPEAVRKVRERSAAFRRLEEIARHGTGKWAQSYVEAGLRALAPGMMQALAALIEARNPQVVLKALDWLRGKPQEVDVLLGDVSELSDEERASRIMALLERARARRARSSDE